MRYTPALSKRKNWPDSVIKRLPRLTADGNGGSNGNVARGVGGSRSPGGNDTCTYTGIRVLMAISG